jgi:hypothetical protein
MIIETIITCTILTKFTNLMNKHTFLSKSTTRKVWAFLCWMEINALLIFTGWEIFAFYFSLINKLSSSRYWFLPALLFSTLRILFPTFCFLFLLRRRKFHSNLSLPFLILLHLPFWFW